MSSAVVGTLYYLISLIIIADVDDEERTNKRASHSRI